MLRGGVVLAIGVVGLCACERKPFFREPPPYIGGLTLQCLGVTDFQKRLAPCNFDTDEPGGGCACQQAPLATPLPPAVGSNAAGAVVFTDSSCTTTRASACVPKVIPTTGQWDEEGLPAGQLWLEQALLENQYNIIDDLRPTRGDGAGVELHKVWEDADRATFRACHLAHFGWLAVEFFGTQYHTLAWRSALERLQLEYSSFTSVIDSHSLDAAWDAGGALASAENAYGSKVHGPAPTACNEGMIHPFDFSSVGVFDAPGDTANPPSPDTLASARHCPGGDCALAPLSYDLAVEPSASMALITVSGDGESDQAGAEVQGTLHVDTANCERDAEGDVLCEATLASAVIFVDSFSLFGEDVAFVRVEGGRTPSRGVLQGSALVIPSFRGTAEVRLADGRYDFLDIESGAFLGRWEPESDSFLAAFAFEGALDHGVNARVEGTVGGAFDNISPIAIAEARAASQATDARADRPDATWGSRDVVTIECAGPQGTPVELDAGHSMDFDDDALRFVWRSPADGGILSTEASFITEPLTLGGHGFALRAFDRRGRVGEGTAALEIVDTEPPAFVDIDAPACLWPPSHELVHLGLGQELLVRAVDRCAGDVSGAVRVAGVRSSDPEVGRGDGAMDPDIVMTDDGVCLRAERAANSAAGERLYTITIAVEDDHGNEEMQEIEIVVPHDLHAPSRRRGCASPEQLQPCDTGWSSQREP